MNDYAPQSLIVREAQPCSEAVTLEVPPKALTLGASLVVGAAFAVYLLTALYLGARDGDSYFGADPDYYEVLARHTYDYTAARFHPTTVLLGLGWMKLFSPLEIWIAPHILLKAMFAAVGAVGVLGAIVAFTVLLPRGYGLLGGIIYALSLGAWYFAAIPESKILTASLTTLYIAMYARYRDDWSRPRTIALNSILAIACFNEIVAGFLVAIPAVDALRRGIDWPRVRLIGMQVAIVLVALLVLETLVNGRFVPESQYSQEQSHFALFWAYFARFTYNPAKFHDFAANWFFFNLVAPTPHALWWSAYGGYFEPDVTAYRMSPIAMATVFVIAVMIAVGLISGVRSASVRLVDRLLLPLAAYAIVRAMFFVVFSPSEALLFSPAVTLVHWLFVLVPFTVSHFPAKRALLAALCVLLFATNAGFMLGPGGWSGLWTRIAGA